MTKTSCAEIEARLIDAVDERLDAADSLRFHAHLETCVACRERAALWRGLVPALPAGAPPPPDAMAVRRLRIEIEHQLAKSTTRPRLRSWRLGWLSALGVAAAAAAWLIWSPHAARSPETVQKVAAPVGPAPAEPVASASYVTVATAAGTLRVDGNAVEAGTRVPAGALLALGAEATASLVLEGGARIELVGPARLRANGSAREVALLLESGRLEAEVAHRAPDQTFAVSTEDLRVVVRGTKFVVSAGRSGSRVEVTEGRVAVERAGRETRLVSAGESFETNAPTGTIGCGDAVRGCKTATRAIRAAMRKSDANQALRLLGQLPAAPATTCAAFTPCDDELGYLRAEALAQGGRLAAAVVAYHALDRKGAPPAMRQNALFAAGQIEKRRGHLKEASDDFERALAAAPRGALQEEALVGGMESARGAGDLPRARGFAARYLASFPRGRAAAAARDLIGAP